MLVLNQEEVERLLDMEGCIGAMEGALATLARGEMDMPLRFIFGPAGGVTQQLRSSQVGAHFGNERADHIDLTHRALANLSRSCVQNALLEACPQESHCRAGRAEPPVLEGNGREV